ncbi:MAG: DUF2726 domain-containing protein [Burkholderiaceae bacterium]|jgi:hypothetical protein|nr:DUF2726 domain-containing protein [Burkholderiaceae bacterium]
MFNDSLSAFALAAVLALLITYVLMRRRPSKAKRGTTRNDALDTVADWPPEAARVMTTPERKAYETTRRALPQQMVLSQVPLSRFLRVPTRHSYSLWVSRVGCLNADLVVCDQGSRVLAVIDVRPAQQSSRARKRHERMSRVLRAAHINVLTWSEGALPSVAEVRAQMAPLLQDGAQGTMNLGGSRPMPLIPVAEMEEILARGDALAQDVTMEPVSSTLFDDLDALPATGTGSHP